MAYEVTLIRGDGVGPELAEAAKMCIEATGVSDPLGRAGSRRRRDGQAGHADPRQRDRIVPPHQGRAQGPDHHPRRDRISQRQRLSPPGPRPLCLHPSVQDLPRRADLFLATRPSTWSSSARTPRDLYFGCEFEQGKPETAELIADIKRLNGKTVRPDSGISIKAISITGTRRIVKYAFEYARKHGRKKVTSVHKANILKFTDGLFLEVSREVAKEYPDIEFEDRIVDNMCMQLVQKPELYDVLVLPNLYGDIVSDLCAGLVGGLGVAPGANIGEAGAVFEATHGSAPKYKGQYKMNPTALILSGVLMLEHLGETEAARRLEKAVARGDRGRQGRHLRHEAEPR